MADEVEFSVQDFDAVDESFFETEDVSQDEKEKREREADRQKFSKDFSFRQLGSIAQYIEPVSVSHPLEYVLNVFEDNPEIQAVPVEEYDVVVGYIDRKTLEEATKNVLQRFVAKDTIKYVKRVPLILYAKEYSEQVLEKLSAAQRDYNVSFFPIFHHRKSFYGLMSFDALLERIADIRRQDMEKARVVQQGILPDASSLAELPFKVCAWNRMANPIGGDLYATYKLSDSKYLVGCFDVSGKNVAAALVTIALGSFFSALKRFPQVATTPGKIIAELDLFIEDIVPMGTFITAGICCIDLQTQRISVFNCGHTNIYFFLPAKNAENAATGNARKIKVSEIEAFLPPLGMGAAAQNLTGDGVKIPCCQIVPGLRAELYSDGLPDMQTDEGVRYGDDRVKDFFKSIYGAEGDDVTKKIEEAVAHWTGKAMLPDDITVVDIMF